MGRFRYFGYYFGYYFISYFITFSIIYKVRFRRMFLFKVRFTELLLGWKGILWRVWKGFKLLYIDLKDEV